MSALSAVFLREFASFFRTPLGWVVVALFLFLSGIVFAYGTLYPGGPASLREFFQTCWSLLIVVAPAISMRLVAEELRTGTIEPLLTSPLPEISIVLGKYLAGVAFLCTALAPTLVFAGLLMALSSPDPGPMIAGYAGIILLGMLYLAVGTLLSCLTASQTLAFLSTLFVLVLVEMGSQRLAVVLPEPWSSLAIGLSSGVRVADFAKGVVDSAHVVYFLAVSGWLITLAGVVLRMRRWR
ncbi:MAG: ABC transporter permease subunit [Phycisphaerales bacterium]